MSLLKNNIHLYRSIIILKETNNIGQQFSAVCKGLFCRPGLKDSEEDFRDMN